MNPNNYEDFVRLEDFDISEGTYLDFAGACFPSRRQLNEVFNELHNNSTLGNPHSRGNFSKKTEHLISEARQRVLSFVGTTSSEYVIVFTSGTTSSCKLIAECFPWTSNSVYCYPSNVHNSLLGIRTFAPNVYCLPSNYFNCKTLFPDPKIHPADRHPYYHLMAVVGECNFSGSKSNLFEIGKILHDNKGMNWLKRIPGVIEVSSLKPESESCNKNIRNKNLHNNHVYPEIDVVNNELSEWMWFLDASKLTATSILKLNDIPALHRPHFVTLSFYKIFGYPTGIGALLIRNDCLSKLRKRYISWLLPLAN